MHAVRKQPKQAMLHLFAHCTFNTCGMSLSCSGALPIFERARAIDTRLFSSVHAAYLRYSTQCG